MSAERSRYKLCATIGALAIGAIIALPPLPNGFIDVLPLGALGSTAAAAPSLAAAHGPAVEVTRDSIVSPSPTGPTCGKAVTRTLGAAWGTSCPRYDLELVCRVNGASEGMLRGSLLSSLRVYWPHERFGRVALVFDEDSEPDRLAAGRLATDYKSLIRVVYANRTVLDVGGGPPRLDENRPHGYHMQQYDTMLVDHFSDAAYIGVVDSDSLLVTAPTESDFFDERGLPRVVPRVETPSGRLWEGAAAASNFVVGKPQPFRCMSHFPVIWKREHFPLFRAHVEKTHGGKPFGAVYSEMILSYSLFYSQFNIMCTYLYWYHRDEYAWSYWLPNGRAGPEWAAKHSVASASVPGASTDYSFVTAENSMPIARPFIHWKHAGIRLRPDVHMILGFCWLMRGKHRFCEAAKREDYGYGQLDFASTTQAHQDLFYFEYVSYEDGRVVDAHAAHYDRVRDDLKRGLWSINGIEDALVAAHVAFTATPAPYEEPPAEMVGINWRPSAVVLRPPIKIVKP